MKLLSIQYLAQSATQSLMRFPWVIISALVGVCAGIYLAEQHNTFGNDLTVVNLILTAGLGIGLFFSINVYCESHAIATVRKRLFELAGLLSLVAIYFTLPDTDSTYLISKPYIRFGLCAIVIHLAVAFMPFIRKGRINGFWNYNKALFIRVLTSGLYSAFLYGGLALALGSLYFLFDIELHEELFLDMFILIAGLFNTWFFITGIPRSFDELEDLRTYPNGIKIFAQYILLSLLILYLFILYLYTAKIVLLWDWPKGIVSYLVICVSVLGILTLLLMYPYAENSENSWIKKFSRGYYIILLPLVILLFIAISMRLSDYGITINRYAIFVLGIWLTVVCGYYILGKTSIKFVPISLAVVTLLSSFGPWGIFAVSERSQVKRLTAILENAGILKDGKIKNGVEWKRDASGLTPANTTEQNENILNDSLHNEVYSILRYLDDHHGFKSIHSWTPQNLDSMMAPDTEGNWKADEPSIYMRTLGLSDDYKDSDNQQIITYSTEYVRNALINVKGYDYLVTLEDYYYSDERTFDLDGVRYEVLLHFNTPPEIKLQSSTDTLIFKADELVNELRSHYGDAGHYSVPQESLTVVKSNDKIEAKLLFRSITVSVHEDEKQTNTPGADSDSSQIHFTSLQANLLIRKK